MDCVVCEKCKLWGKLQILGIGTAIKILLHPNDPVAAAAVGASTGTSDAGNTGFLQQVPPTDPGSDSAMASASGSNAQQKQAHVMQPLPSVASGIDDTDSSIGGVGDEQCAADLVAAASALNRGGSISSSSSGTSRGRGRDGGGSSSGTASTAAKGPGTSSPKLRLNRQELIALLNVLNNLSNSVGFAVQTAEKAHAAP
jgi:hypothetical protein